MAYGTINADVIQSSVTGVSLGAGNATRFKNRIINGNMVIDQRNAGASFTVTAGYPYCLDRWISAASISSKYTVQQNAGSVTPPAGFSNYLGATSSSAYSVGAAELFSINQFIEGFNTADLGWGTANAKTVTLSFWVRSSLTGTFGGALTNTTADRSYPFSYTISVANTWEQKSITIAGDTTGTWVGATNGIGIKVWLGLGVGTTYSGTAGAWAATTYVSATGAVSVVGTSGATFYITGVQLEVGSSATGFDYRDYTSELAMCQRYYWQTNTNMGFAIAVNVTGGGVVRTPVTMRTSPSIASGATFQVSAGSAGTVGLLNSTGFAVSPDGVVPYNTGANWTTTVGVQFIGGFSAEL